MIYDTFGSEQLKEDLQEIKDLQEQIDRALHVTIHRNRYGFDLKTTSLPEKRRDILAIIMSYLRCAQAIAGELAENINFEHYASLSAAGCEKCGCESCAAMDVEEEESDDTCSNENEPEIEHHNALT